jgi:hypothetical protein
MERAQTFVRVILSPAHIRISVTVHLSQKIFVKAGLYAAV